MILIIHLKLSDLPELGSQLAIDEEKILKFNRFV